MYIINSYRENPWRIKLKTQIEGGGSPYHGLGLYLLFVEIDGKRIPTWTQKEYADKYSSEEEAKEKFIELVNILNVDLNLWLSCFAESDDGKRKIWANFRNFSVGPTLLWTEWKGI